MNFTTHFLDAQAAEDPLQNFLPFSASHLRGVSHLKTLFFVPKGATATISDFASSYNIVHTKILTPSINYRVIILIYLFTMG